MNTLTRHIKDLNSVFYSEDHAMLLNVAEFEYFMHIHNLIPVLLQHQCWLKIDVISDAVLFCLSILIYHYFSSTIMFIYCGSLVNLIMHGDTFTHK